MPIWCAELIKWPLSLSWHCFTVGAEVQRLLFICIIVANPRMWNKQDIYPLIPVHVVLLPSIRIFYQCANFNLKMRNFNFQPRCQRLYLSAIAWICLRLHRRNFDRCLRVGSWRMISVRVSDRQYCNRHCHSLGGRPASSSIYPCSGMVALIPSIQTTILLPMERVKNSNAVVMLADGGAAAT